MSPEVRAAAAPATAQPTDPSTGALRIGAYAVLYLVWGSTYLAMWFAVQTLPPFLLGAARFTVAGFLLLALGRARGAALPAPRQWGHSAAVGALLLVGGNASVLWAVQHVPTGTTALIIAITPLWLALLSRARPTRGLVLGILLGLVGVSVLVAPAIAAHQGGTDAFSVAMLVFASFTWAIGSLRARKGGPVDGTVATGAQMLTGGLMLALLGLATGELELLRGAEVSLRSLLALGYLTVFGSLLGFSAYGWLLRNDSPTRAATYAYVNPVVAVLLGAVFADEAITPRVLLAGGIIVLGVALIVRGK